LNLLKRSANTYNYFTLKKIKKQIINVLIIFSFGLIPALICQNFTEKPVSRNIHVRSFRYGKDPSVIRCNRGDTLHLTFSTDDTGHSFYLEEFDIDAKISPARDVVEVFKTSDPTQKSVTTRELTFIAHHSGIQNFLVARSNYRCHVWCGPMHAFEMGKLVIMPNTLLTFSLGCTLGILFLWLLGIFRNTHEEESGYRDVMKPSGILRKIIQSRWPQTILIIFAMMMIYVVLLTTLFGTKVSGRNLGVLLMWAIWLFLLVALLTPFLGRTWCSMCPLPFFGDWLQRRSFFTPRKGKTKEYNNLFSGLFMKWPARLKNDWLKLVVFLMLTTFSAALVADPKVSAMAVILLVLAPTIMALIWENRTFCRYICPVSAFVGPFSRMSPVALRSKSQQVCDNCKPHYCQKGSPNGWACPYGLNMGEIKENQDCGLCLECTRSCLYNNVTLYQRPVFSELGTRNRSEAWLTMAVFSLSIVYSILYEGSWADVRDYVNILDKQNWGLFALYTLFIWTLSLILVPGLVYGLSLAATKLSKIKRSVNDVFLASTGALLPLGLMLWIAFVIPMLFVNITFITQSMSDPFGWGWDFFGTANIPWHQFVPRLVPWIQALLILTGLWYSLRNLKKSWIHENLSARRLFLITLPMAVLITIVAVAMVFFHTN
jgi:hypothetical protein